MTTREINPPRYSYEQARHELALALDLIDSTEPDRDLADWLGRHLEQRTEQRTDVYSTACDVAGAAPDRDREAS